MKFCYIKDLNIPWFVGMVERSRHLPNNIAYDDTYVWVYGDEEVLPGPYVSPWELPSPWAKRMKLG